MKEIRYTLFGVLGGLISSAIFYFFILSTPTPPSPASSQPQEITTPTQFSSLGTKELAELNADFVKASGSSRNSVVYIKTIFESRRSLTWMDLFFGGQGSTQQVLSSGSGVIWSRDGHIVTNNHVIENANEIEVILRKKPYKAKVVGRYPSADLAVLKIEGDRFPAIELGSSRELGVGEWVLAVGNPFNLTSTVTAGIVSATGRDLGIVKDKFPLESFIQTDAAINPGNSGGALVNLNGKLVGINTAILSRTGSYAGYGFAVPVDVVKKIVEDLIKYGKVQKAFIGAGVSDLDYELAQQLDVDNLDGVVVTYVREEGPADNAGILQGDIIRSLDGYSVETEARFEEEMSCRAPGDKVTLLIERKGKTLSIPLQLVNEQGELGIVKTQIVSSADLGADFEEISLAERQLYGIENGVRISEIKPGIVEQIGIQDGFVLLEINGNSIEEPSEAIKAISKTRGRVIIKGINKDGVAGYYSYYR